MNKILITLTGPSCSGKTTLLDFIKLNDNFFSTLISTTTRPQRPDEINGKTYFFISNDESLKLEQNNALAELVIYNGHRYGVTKEEFNSKLKDKPAILIIEPSGIERYTKYAIDANVKYLKIWIHTDKDTIYQRYLLRAASQLFPSLIGKKDNYSAQDKILKLEEIFDRYKSMISDELKWFSLSNWDLILSGAEDPRKNIELIKLKLQIMEKEYLK